MTAPARHCGLDPQSRGAGTQGGPSFPRRRAVYGTRMIRRLRISAESRESRRDSSETRQSTGWCGCFVLFHPLLPVSGTGTGFDSSPIKRPLQNLPSFPRRRESIVKMQLERLRIIAHYRCSTEFCKGLHQGRGGFCRLCWLVVCPAATPLDCGSSPQ